MHFKQGAWEVLCGKVISELIHREKEAGVVDSLTQHRPDGSRKRKKPVHRGQWGRDTELPHPRRWGGQIGQEPRATAEFGFLLLRAKRRYWWVLSCRWWDDMI